METTFDCIPCLVRQTLDSVRLATADTAIQALVLRRVLAMLSGMSLSQSPPALAQKIHRVIREASGCADPYAAVKREFNAAALALYPKLKAQVATAAAPLEAAVRLAIAGNIIDFGAFSTVNRQMVADTIANCLAAPLAGDVGELQQRIATARRILYLSDNAGEIVFDRLLIEQLPAAKITVAVRGGAVINDATMADAVETGLADLVTVISNGSDAPATLLEDCDPEFRRCFALADLIIAKGQGNYESLSHSRQPVYFLLKAKCPVIAAHIGCRLGDAVIARSTGNAVPEADDGRPGRSLCRGRPAL